jgi:hypothetical protein
MITYLVVGRNDYYGINLHKRTAISLNFFGSLCEGADDEIVYVDCNTPEHELTLAEAIADTLTPETRRRLRIFRISGAQMHDAIGDTPLPFSDELSRNVGIRRSNPRNEWLLSTNCDILLLPLASGSMHQLLSQLPRKFYLCPRGNIEPPQWQELDRMDVAGTAKLCEAVVRQGMRPPTDKPEWLRFSSVGDFQLAPRDQWFAMGGCEEGMKLWGHSDANNARRLNLLNGGGRTPDVADHIAALHLDHNPTRASAHEGVLPNNDWKFWVDEVTRPESRNSAEWGLRDVALPEIRLNAGGTISAEEILRKHRRERNLLRTIQTRMISGFWRKVGALANRVESRLRQDR